MDLLRQLFSHFCGQVNSWHAAGVASVACQRCTGLYVGALIAAVLFILFRPRPTSLSLWLHGLAMLLIIPFGYHLVPQGAIVRAVTGQLFGYGMAYFLLLVPTDHFALWNSSVPYPSRPLLARGWGSSLYLISLLVAIPVVILTATSSTTYSIVALAYLTFAGLLSLTYLISCNLLILATIAWLRLRARTAVPS